MIHSYAMQYKIRQAFKPGVNNKNRSPQFCIAVPKEKAIFHTETKFNIVLTTINEIKKMNIDAPCLLYISGSNFVPTKEEVESYEFEDCKV